MASTSGWTSASHPKEIERLTQLLWHYETVNQDQKAQLDSLVTSRDNLVHRIQLQDQEKKKQAKQMRSLELQLKYEKTATEGLRKKAGLFEKEVIDMKEIVEKSQNHEHDMSNKKTTLEQELKEERAYRLQLVHEKEKLQEEINRISALLQRTEQKNVEAVQKVLNLQQDLETANSRSTRQEKLIKVQSDEIISLNAELLRLKERFLGKTRDLLEEQRNHADYHLTMDKMQEEISFLRKELTVTAKGLTESDIASSINPRKTKRQNATTKMVNNKTAQRYEVSHFRDEGTFTRQHHSVEFQASTTSLSTNTSQLKLENPSLYSTNSKISGEVSASYSPGKSWISDTFPQSSSTVDTHQSFLSSSSPVSRAGTASRQTRNNKGVPPLSMMQLTPLATRDRPRDSLDYAQPNIDVDNETQAYFNNPDRIALLQWIRTASRQASRQKSSVSPERNASSTQPQQETSHNMNARVKDIKQLYASQPVGPTNAKVPNAPPSSLQAFSQEVKPFQQHSHSGSSLDGLHTWSIETVPTKQHLAPNAPVGSSGDIAANHKHKSEKQKKR